MKLIFIKTELEISSLSTLINEKLFEMNINVLSHQHRDSINRGGEYVLYKTPDYELYLCPNNEESSPTESLDWLDFQIYIQDNNEPVDSILEMLNGLIKNLDSVEKSMILDV